jgi:hypothetical protein
MMFCVFLLSGCAKEDDMSIIFVHESLQGYFTAFEEEGLLRGLSADLKSAEIEGMLTDLPGSVSGRCQYNTDKPRQVQIDQSYFESVGNLRREFIVFHELGHCYLNREHLDVRDENGNCVSIMHSSSATCRNAYNSVTREKYLDELFETN